MAATTHQAIGLGRRCVFRVRASIEYVDDAKQELGDLFACGARAVPAIAGLGVTCVSDRAYLDFVGSV